MGIIYTPSEEGVESYSLGFEEQSKYQAEFLTQERHDYLERERIEAYKALKSQHGKNMQIISLKKRVQELEAKLKEANID